MRSESDASQERLAGLAAFLPEFERDGFVFGQWEGGEELPGGRGFSMPNYTLSESAMAFYKAVYELEWVSPQVDWMEWSNTRRGKQLLGNPNALAKASAEELSCVITTCIRRDRFCEGALAGDFRDGRLLAILRRAAVLLAAVHPPGP